MIKNTSLTGRGGEWFYCPADGQPPFLDQISSSPHGYECTLQYRGTAPALQPLRAGFSLNIVDLTK